MPPPRLRWPGSCAPSPAPLRTCFCCWCCCRRCCSQLVTAAGCAPCLCARLPSAADRLAVLAPSSVVSGLASPPLSSSTDCTMAFSAWYILALRRRDAPLRLPDPPLPLLAACGAAAACSAALSAPMSPGMPCSAAAPPAIWPDSSRLSMAGSMPCMAACLRPLAPLPLWRCASGCSGDTMLDSPLADSVGRPGGKEMEAVWMEPRCCRGCSCVVGRDAPCNMPDIWLEAAATGVAAPMLRPRLAASAASRSYSPPQPGAAGTPPGSCPTTPLAAAYAAASCGSSACAWNSG
mmetsp:Transcript_25207/g.64004  ORF Transcript_25207/g.64004 Transcript_25207/m.64004 type:complete len:292 (-) Transcript_25207:824-1699(-)